MKYCRSITVGLILTAVLVRAAYVERGYIAVGGEWLAMPIILALRSFIVSIIKEVRG